MSTTPTERGGTGGVERRYGGRGAAVWCGVVLENPPSLRSYARATFFFFLLLLPNEGGEEDRVLRARRKAGREGEWSACPRFLDTEHPPSNRDARPPRTKNHRTPLVGHACTPARANARYPPPPPGPSPFAADEWTYVSFVLTFFSVFETQPTNTSSFFSHNNRDQGTKKRKKREELHYTKKR